MLETKPPWYDELKSGPLGNAPKPTQDIINSIEERVNLVGTRKNKIIILGIPLACCLLLVLISAVKMIGGFEGNFPVQDEDRIISTQQPQDDNIVIDDKGNVIAIDRDWLMSKEAFLIYESFSTNKTDETLMGVTPLDTFLIYKFASERSDYETMYALLIKGPNYGTPPREKYLSDIAKDPGLKETSKNHWDTWKRTYLLKEEVNGDKAIIRMTTDPITSNRDEKIFRLIKNEKGVWKVDWPPM